MHNVKMIQINLQNKIRLTNLEHKFRLTKGEGGGRDKLRGWG